MRAEGVTAAETKRKLPCTLVENRWMELHEEEEWETKRFLVGQAIQHHACLLLKPRYITAFQFHSILSTLSGLTV